MSGVQGNVWYVGSQEDLTRLLSGDAPHAPYVAFVDGRDLTTQAALTNKCVCVCERVCVCVCACMCMCGLCLGSPSVSKLSLPHSSIAGATCYS